jgi:hypothetical protein
VTILAAGKLADLMGRRAKLPTRHQESRPSLPTDFQN